MNFRPVVGVLALQGGVAEHASLLEKLGAQVVLVKRPEQLEELDVLVLPGGESTTIDRLTRIFGLRQPLIDAIAGGLPTLGTCAGLILLAREIEDPAAGQQTLGLLNVTVRRNAFGSQVDSAETELAWDATGADGDGPVTGAGGQAPVKAAFIRAPIVTQVGEDVTVLARHAGQVVGVQQGHLLGISFHPELTGDTTVHRALLGLTSRAEAS
ncbi:pyridoxal 5'-phosphate synthase glutaminase subunit PdxT [Rothia nasimurium]|uniref:Pyridoxal 5'-phosphate synthase subunit PdxT n=1 Tax=Rothia nasimurium TaxID=85336 RepID=A0A4Y9F020_9MICC|nr:pyridoxal 5'-phosphate synthase glutaminase subunit PdxT [Rothia nasimurium]MBF0809372.1 pyridoxal 5'-phosphate synthase glutaminase subunit PdxT [Rothia nasimurium]TFU19609.1 pyridoxal 5'-phosphate synthase glutaminase subunit PdxT [Rothia nasimurium]